MPQYEVHPFEGLGNIRFGMARSVVRALLGPEFCSFRKGKSPVLTDEYHSLGMHLYYDDSDKLEFIEAFKPCDPILHFVHLMGRDIQKVAARLAKIGIEGSDWYDGYDFPSVGVALWAPESQPVSPLMATGRVGSVLICNRHYAEENLR